MLHASATDKFTARFISCITIPFHHLLVPTSHFYPLLYCNSPPFLLSHYSPPFKTISYFHSHPNSSSFQTIHFLFALIYSPFNLSLLFSLRFHTSFFCLFIASCQHLLSPNYSFYLVIPPHTLWVLSSNFH